MTDKICDQVSDAILDACLKEDPHSKVACGEWTCSVITRETLQHSANPLAIFSRTQDLPWVRIDLTVF